MRVSRDITGWAFLADVGGVRHAGLAIGLASIDPFTTSVEYGGGSLYKTAYINGLGPVRSLDELPFEAEAVPGWCVTPAPEGDLLSVRAPAPNEVFAHDLELPGPPGWRETADASGAVMLVVSHVLPLVADMLGQLTFEAEQGHVCAGRVRFGDFAPPHSSDRPTATLVFDPPDLLFDLAIYVHKQIMSLDEAKRRARRLEDTRRILEQYDAVSAEAMLDLLLEQSTDSHGLHGYMYVYWRLVTEAADVCGVDSAWQLAALRTVEQATAVLAERCDRAIFQEAYAVSQQLISRLRDADDPDALEAALLAAARLRMATRGPENLAADARVSGAPTTCSARLQADLYRAWFTDEEPFQAESPKLVVEAGHLAVEALHLGRGTQRPRLLALLARILADDRQEDRTAHAALLALLDSGVDTAPDIALFLARTTSELDPGLVEDLIAAVFGTTPQEFHARHGSTMTAAVISQGINLALERHDRPLLRTALSWADQLRITQDSAHRRQLCEARLHALPDDPTECPSPDQNIAYLQSPSEGSWTPDERSAALLHLAAHARERHQPALGLSLLREASDDGSNEARLLSADLHHQAAEAGEPGPGPLLFPWGYYAYAALGYASLGMSELAQASLVPFVAHLGDLHGEQLEGALSAIIIDLPNFRTSGAPELSEVLRDLAHTAVWQLTAHAEEQPWALMLGLHQAVKGPERGAWWRIEGPLELPGYIQHWQNRLRELQERSTSPGLPVRLTGSLDTDHRPAGEDDEEIATNLRWYISSLIDEELYRESTPFIDDQQIWARVHELLDERTVLLTWFLPAFVRGSVVLLAVTREGRDLVVYLGDGADDEDRHPVANEVDAIRAEVLHNPLFADVTPEGAQLLELGDTLLGGNEKWAAWREQGKEQVLVWPHGPLHYLPMALCRTNGRVIAEDWTVTTIAGFEALAPGDGSRTRPRRTAVLASAIGGVPYGFPHEPALEEHARAVAETASTQAITDRAATRERLRAELATADIVHIAVHGSLDPGAPWLHCLYLTPDSDDDGRVFAADFLEVDLRGVRLVTLAACESALGRFDRSDNIRGIPSALITAGAEAIVACLWPVRPEPATYFYQHMHEKVTQGADPVPAFRQAQLATRTRYPHYRDWGAFSYLRGRNQGAGA